MILELKKVTKTFGKLTAVSDLSFSVEEGEIFGVAGPNGAGKTTLFNIISGFYRATGSIVFDNQKIDRCRPDQICNMGLARIFQIPLIFESMTIYKNVLIGAHFGGRHKRDRERRIDDALSFFGLEEKKDQQVNNLKLLDKKLTMTAAAFATNPRLFLLDEPVAGLSPSEANHFVALIKKLNRERGLTIIMIEHLMNILTEVSDRLMILNNGQKVTTGFPEDVVKNAEVIECYLGKGNA
jgi:branched-chain amino acid transport system ATP-binding protein